MNIYLLIQISVIILACIGLNNLSGKLGVPTLLGFILLGVLLGNHGVISLGYIGFPLAERICEIALIFIMFYGGFGTRWDAVKPIVGVAGLLSTLGVVITALITGVFCHLVLRWGWAESLLLGSVVSSTDAASVFSILKSKRLNLKNYSAPILEVESGSNDPIGHMLTITMISVLNVSASPSRLVLNVLLEIVLGAFLGVVIAQLGAFGLRKMRFRTEGFISLYILTVAMLAYAIPVSLHGNGFLSVYIVGVMMGNKYYANKKMLVHFFDGITTLMEVLVFFILGALAKPSGFSSAILPALGIFLCMLILARPLAVNAVLLPFRRFSFQQRRLIGFSGLRGAASIVFAILAVNGTYLGIDFFNIVFCIVLLSMSLQGTLLPLMSRRLDMIDRNGNVLRTFNDFDDDDVFFGKLNIEAGSSWEGKSIRELSLPEGIIIALIFRNGERILPSGSVVIQAGDLVITLSKVYYGSGSRIKEKTIKADSRRVGKAIRENPGSSIIIMIKRGEECIIPNRDTILEAGDRLVILDLQD
ncbi:MAG: potassium/proton antiporter [Bacteroidales bacterium]|nr:potassium/proton antiporter [Bacteroidales bacterium]